MIEQQLEALLAEVRPRVVAWRRHFHRHPELSFAEHATARTIGAALTELGLAPVSLTPTSVVADIAGGRPGRTIAVRADIDALPIGEESGLAFASTAPGVMHACGHDGHTAVLLGVATVLTELRDELPGRIRLIFQHGEERPPCGATELIAAGVLDGVEAIVGEHLWAPLPVGVVGVAAGATMGSIDNFSLHFEGRGGHAAQPHDTRDPAAAAVDCVQALQRLVAREVDPLQPAVVSVTRIRAGEVLNVIESEASVGGTWRTLDAPTRAFIRERIERIAHDVARAHRMEAHVKLDLGPPPLVNDTAVATVLERAARADPAVEVRQAAPMLVGEDFAFYLERVPGAFAFVGAGLPDVGGPFPHHHPRFVIDEEALPIATGLLTRAALALAEPAGVSAATARRA